MNDRDALILALGDFIGSISKNMFGLNLSSSGSILIKLGVENLLKKEPYKFIADFFFDDEGNLSSQEEFFSAMKDVFNQKPMKIMNVRFNGNDIEEIRKAFIENKKGMA